MNSLAKKYYPFLDLLKYVCCILIVCIHTRPTYYCPEYTPLLISFTSLAVPLFFMVSSYLVGGKLEFVNADIHVLKHFVKRLFILYTVWTIAIFPSWFFGFYWKHPDDWFILLPIKFFFTDTAHGSWFILALIYGLPICYLLNRFIGKNMTTILLLAFDTYVRLCVRGHITDYLHICLDTELFGIELSPFIALLPIQLGLMLRKTSMPAFLSPKWLAIGIVAAHVVTYFVEPSVPVVAVWLRSMEELGIVALCAYPFSCKRTYDFSLLRNMSIIIYFTHFIVDITFRTLAQKGLVTHNGGANLQQQSCFATSQPI